MAYVDPLTVQSPKGDVRDIDVIYDKGSVQQSWSVATLKWKERDAVGIRWNGEPGNMGNGSPQSRGHATWFIVPEEIADAVLKAAHALDLDKDRELAAGYAAMAADTEREAEAMVWSEALIGDGFEAR
jgi:hypothetical protein